MQRKCSNAVYKCGGSMKGSKFNINTKRIREYAILLSIVLHLLMLWFMGKTPSLAFSDLLPEPPVVLEPIEKQYDRMAFELVETPSDIPEELPSAETDLASDQSAKATDNYSKNDIEKGLPYSEGYTDSKNYPEIVTQNDIQDEVKEQQQEETLQSDNSFLTAFKKMQKKYEEQKANIPEPAYDNPLSSAEDMGGFSFNTYDWNFAPYLITMKRRIRSNMNLPYAFTHLGAVSGDIQVRFEVLPTGVVNKLEVLSSDAHYSLEDSSVNAVRNSSAFDPLPDDFPEDRLVVTARFSFSIIDHK